MAANNPMGNVSRAKDPKIVAEGNKPILWAKKGLTYLAVGLTLLFARYEIWFVKGPLDAIVNFIFN